MMLDRDRLKWEVMDLGWVQEGPMEHADGAPRLW